MLCCRTNIAACEINWHTICKIPSGSTYSDLGRVNLRVFSLGYFLLGFLTYSLSYNSEMSNCTIVRPQPAQELMHLLLGSTTNRIGGKYLRKLVGSLLSEGKEKKYKQEKGSQ